MSDSLSTTTDDLAPHNVTTQVTEPAVPAEPATSVGQHREGSLTYSQTDSHINSQTHTQLPYTQPHSHSHSHSQKARWHKHGYELFVGNVSYFCTEVDLFRLFSAVGHVLKVRIKRSGTAAGRTLMYGFVDFAEEEQAERAVETFNGTRQMGRDMRVERCSHGQNKRDGVLVESNNLHYEVHITFTSYFPPSSLIYPTEMYLRSLFEAQGFALRDIAVKNYRILPDNKQEGFGYVELFTEEDAHHFVSLFRNAHIQGFAFRCELGRNNPTNSSSNSTSNSASNPNSVPNSTSISPSISPSVSAANFSSNSTSISAANSPSLSPIHSPRYPLPLSAAPLPAYPTHSHAHAHFHTPFVHPHHSHAHAHTPPLQMFSHTHMMHSTMHNAAHSPYNTHAVMYNPHTHHNTHTHSRAPLVPPIPLMMPVPVSMPVCVPVVPVPVHVPGISMNMPMPSLPPQNMYYTYNNPPQSGSSSGANTPRYECMP